MLKNSFILRFHGLLLNHLRWDRMIQVLFTPDQIYRKRSLGEIARRYLLHWLGLRKPPLGVYSNESLKQLIRR